MGIYGADASTLHEAQYSQIMGGNNNQIRNGINNGILFGTYNTISGSTDTSEIIGSDYCSVISNADRSTIIASSGSTISGHTEAVMLGCSGRTSTRSTATFVENLVVFNYAALDFPNDGAAAAGGVVLGQIYHNNGDMKIRIS
jgi:hypothetical protein